jgi:general stress protein 26
MKTPKAPESPIQELQRLIDGIEIAMFASVDGNGRIHSRPMATQQIEFDGDLWFFTGKATLKCAELGKNPQVNVTYSEPSANRYVSVSGPARLVEDRKKAEELWSPILKAWFPKGLDDPNLVLLRVSVEQAEYWDAPSSTVVQLVGFTKAILTGHTYQASEKEHQKLDLTG